MKRIVVLVAMAALALSFGVSVQRPLDAPTPAEAVNTTWIHPSPPIGYQVPAGGALENTEFFLTPPCSNCWITRVEPDLIYQSDPAHPDGTSANFNTSNTTDGVWNHHFVIVDSCNPANRVISAGNERTVLQYPAGYGTYVAPGCTWILNYHIHNSGLNPRWIAIRLNVTYQTTPLATATPLWLDISTATNSEYTAPTGYSHMHTGDSGMHADYTMSLQGKILGMGGHVHDYGYSVSAFNTGAGDRPDDWICTSVAGYGSGSRYLPMASPDAGPGHPVAANAQTLNHAYHQPATPDDAYHIQAMSPCTISERMSIICPGDVIRLHAQYNNTSGFPVPDVMGIMVAYIATPPDVPDADSDGTWDGCDTDDSDGDNFSDRVEAAVGTMANDPCGPNAWPADINNDTFVDIIGDISQVTNNFALPVPPAPDRHNIAPDPPDGHIDIIGDLSLLAGLFGQGCGP